MPRAYGVLFKRLCAACLLDTLDTREGMRVFSTEFWGRVQVPGLYEISIGKF